MLRASSFGPLTALILSYLVVRASTHALRHTRASAHQINVARLNRTNATAHQINVAELNRTNAAGLHRANATGVNVTHTVSGMTISGEHVVSATNSTSLHVHSSFAPSYKLQLNNYMNVQYYADFTVGGQTIPAIYDTGSFEVIVLSELCQSCRTSVPVYNAELSTSFQPGERLVAKHQFGSGPVLSKKGLETIIAGPHTSPLVATSQPFWQVIDHNIDVWNEKAKFAAIVGLGHTATVPEMRNANDEQVDPEPDIVMLERMGVYEFAICLEKANGSPGWMITGPRISQLTTSPAFTGMNVVGQMHWGVKMTNVGPGGWDPCDPSCGAIIDSGTSLIAASSDALSALGGLIANIKEDCSNIDELPDLLFDLDGHSFALPPSAYVLKVEHPVDNSTSIWDALFGPPEVSLETSCVPGFMTIDQETQFGPMWILGMPFLRQFYTIFDRTHKKMYAANSDSTCNPMLGMFNAKRKRSPEDFIPMTVDMKALRLPDWAKKVTMSGKKFIF